MSDIKSSVIISDKIDNNLFSKLDRLSEQSLKASENIRKLNSSISSLSTGNINSVRLALQQLTNINPLKNVNLGALQLVDSVAKSQVALAKANASMAQAQLASERLALARQRHATETAKTALKEQELANRVELTARKVVESKARERLAEERLASTKALTAQRQARIDQINKRTSQGIRVYQGGLLQFMHTLNSVGASLANVGKFIDYGDTYQRAVNKLTLVTSSAEQARDRLISLSQGALASYGNLESYTALYTRLDMALKNVGGTASEAMKVTETLSKTVALAGLTSEEASSALLQISQAFNKGKLDGDEFRTVMETMPPLADAIARELSRASGGVKILRGDLLNLAPKGKITSDVMKRAIISMAEEIDARFAKLTPTVAMQLENLSTQATMYFGNLFQNTGIGKGINQALKTIGDNLDTITRLAITVGSSLAIAFAIRGAANLTTSIKLVKNEFVDYRAKILATDTALKIHNITARNGISIIAALGKAIKASPIGLVTLGLTAVMTIGSSVYEYFSGKSLMPELDQDTAKLNDYLNRLEDVKKQMETMSSIQIDREFAKGQNAYNELEKQIKENEKAIQQQERTLRIAVAQEKAYQSAMENSVAVMGVYQGELSLMIKSEEELAQVKADIAEKQDKGDTLNGQRITLLRNSIDLLLEQNERYQEFKKVLDEGTDSNKHSQAEMDNAKVRIKEIEERYGNLNEKIAEMVRLLTRLSGINVATGAEVAWAQGQKQAQKVTEQVKANEQLLNKANDISKRIDLQKKITQAKGKDKSIAQAEMWALNHQEFASIDNKGMPLQKDDKGNYIGKSKLDSLKAEKIEEFEINRLTAEGNKLAKAGASIANKRVREKEKATQKLNEYKQGLIDENNLLMQGYESYEKYQQLYKLKAELQQKGINLSDQEIDRLKKQIDLNTELKEVVKEINRLEENSIAEKQKKINQQLQAIKNAKLSPQEKTGAVDDVFKNAGVTTGVGQGVVNIQNEYELRLQLLKQYHEQAKMSEFEYNQAVMGMSMARDQAIYERQLENLKNMGALGQTVATAFESFENNATGAIMNVLNGTESLGQSMRNLASTILNDVARSIVQMGVKWLAQQMMMKLFGETAQQSQMANATALLSVYSPLATAVSLASYGANSPPAMAGMTAAYGLGKALSVAGARRNGGTVRAGDLYQVGEGNAPEIYQSRGGKQYMIAGDNGRVFSNKEVTGGGSGGMTIVQNITYQGSGDETTDKRSMANLAQTLKASILETIRNEQRAGGELWR